MWSVCYLIVSMPSSCMTGKDDRIHTDFADDSLAVGTTSNTARAVTRGKIVRTPAKLKTGKHTENAVSQCLTMQIHHSSSTAMFEYTNNHCCSVAEIECGKS